MSRLAPLLLILALGGSASAANGPVDLTFADLRIALLDRGDLAPLLLAADLAEPTDVAMASDSVETALSKLNARAADLLPVVESEALPILLGVLTREDVLAAYERELMHQV